MNKNIKILVTGILLVLLLIIIIPVLFYLYGLPYIVSNPNFLEFLQKTVKQNCGAELIVQNPELKTSPKLFISLKSKSIFLSKDGKTLLSIENLDSEISLKQIFVKKIILNKLGADDIYIDVNEIQTLQMKESGEQKPMDYKIWWFDSILYLKKCFILYRNPDGVLIKVFARDLEITQNKNPKYLHFNILTDIEYENKRSRLLFKDFNTIYIKDKKLNVDKFRFIVDKSMIQINGYLDIKNNYEFTVSSKKFKVKSVQELIETDLLIANGKEILSYFKDLNGDFDFEFNFTNKNMNGVIKANKITSKLTPLANIPVTVTKGLIEIGSKDIKIKDFEGYYGSKILNNVKINGDVKDYAKTAKTSLLISGDASNDLMKYISKVAGCNFSMIGLSKIGLKVETDSTGKVQVSGGFKIPKGSDVLIENSSISSTKFDRAIGIKLSVIKNILDIEHINYYISEVISSNKRPDIKPLLAISSNVNIETGQIYKLKFDVSNPLPSEFFNVLINQQIFRRGTFCGDLSYINTDVKHPYINSDVTLKDVRVVGQNLLIKNATIKANNNKTVNIVANGHFRRTDYDFGCEILNKMLFPIIINDIDLTLDDLDIEKVLESFAPRPQLTEEQQKQLQERIKALQAQESKSNVSSKYFEVEEKQNSTTSATTTGSEEAIVFQPNLIAIKTGHFVLKKGKYKLINFGNLKATISLTEKGILEIKSNKFDFAEGISTLKVYCDMVKQNYSIRLGAKNVNSDIIATSTLNLPREISGKSSALLEFYTDKNMKLNGRIQFAIDDGSITKLGLIQYVLNMAAIFRNPVVMISPSTLFDLVNVPDGTFKKISGDLKIKNNIIERMVIKSSSPQLSALIFGRINLENFDSSLRIYTKFSGKNKGFLGFLRNLSLNSLAKKNQLNSEEISYYASELKMLPQLETGEETAQVFLTKVDGDVQTNNFISQLKKIK